MGEKIARPKVILDDGEINAKLDKLKAKGEEIKKKLHLAITFNADYTEVNKLEKELAGVNREMRQMQKQTLDVKKVLANLSGASLDDLVKTKQKLEALIRKGDRNDPGFEKLVEQLKKVKLEMKSVNDQMSVNNVAKKGFISKTNAWLNEWGMMAAGVLASFTGVSLAISKYSDKVRELEDRKLNLQSMTGLSDNEAQYFEDQAKTLSTTKTKEGIRISGEATDMIDAYSLMGSKRPELLKSKEDLAAVTREALILSQASKDSAQAATEATAMAMNQFGAQAKEAARYVNVLAAGSQAGAVAVPQITESLAKMGPAAKNSGLNIEQTVALIETLGEKGIEGAEAGTQIKNVLLSMATGADEFNPKIVGLQTAFENLAKKNLSAQQMLKMFGRESYTAASILISSTPKLKEYEKAVTGTNTAYEQAKTNTSGAKATLAQARNEFTLNAMALAGKLEPAVRSVTITGSSLLKLLMKLPEILKVMAPAIIGVTVAWVAYQYSIAKTTAVARAYIVVNNLLSKSLTSIRTMFATNPVTSWIAVIGLATSAIIALYKNIERAKAPGEDFIKNLQVEKTEAMNAFEALKKTTEGTESRKKAIKLINEKYGDYLPNLLTEKSTLNEINLAYQAVIKSMTKKMFLQSREKELENVSSAYTDRMKENNDDMLQYVKKIGNKKGEIYVSTMYSAIIEAITKNSKKSLGSIWQELYKSYPELRTIGTGSMTTTAGVVQNDSNQWKLYREAKNLLNTQRDYNDEVNRIMAGYDGLAKAMKIDLSEPAADESGDPADDGSGGSGSSAGSGDNDQKFNKEKESLEKWFRERQNLLKNDYLKQKIDKSRFDAEMYALELTRLIRLKALQQKFGKETTEVEGNILDKRLTIKEDADRLYKESQQDVDQQIKEMTEAGNEDLYKLLDEHLKSTEKRREADQEEQERLQEWEQQKREEAAQKQFEKQKSQYDNFRSLSDDFAQNFGQLLGNVITDQEDAQANFANNLMLIGLDTLHNVVRMAIAQIWAGAMASPESIASWGIAGAAKAAGMSVMVETAFAVAKSVLKRPTPQRAAGKYDVVAEDGNTYSADLNLSPQTGIYTRPTLIAEVGDELIVDGKTLRRIKMRAPHLINQIMEHRVPQRAAGKWDVAGEKRHPNDDKLLIEMIEKQYQVISELNEKLKEPFRGEVVYSNFVDADKKVKAIKRAAKR